MKGKINWFGVFIIIIFPIILGLVLFNPWEKIPLNNIREGNSTYITVPEDYFLRSGIVNSIRNVFGVPFDLKRFNLYFEGEGIYINYPNERIFVNASYEVELNEHKINITTGKIPYGPVELRKKYEYNMRISFPITVKPSYIIHSLEESQEKKVTIEDPVFFVYAKPAFSDVFVKIILFVISWMSICWLITRIATLVYKKPLGAKLQEKR